MLEVKSVLYFIGNVILCTFYATNIRDLTFPKTKTGNDVKCRVDITIQTFHRFFYFSITWFFSTFHYDYLLQIRVKLNCTTNHLKLSTYSIKCYLCWTGMYRSARERDICYFSVICCALEFSLKDVMSKTECSKTVTCTNQILWALLFVKYITYLHKICSGTLTPWRDHFQSLASLIWCPDPEPLSFNYRSQSLTGRQDSSWGHHHMCKYACMCMSVFHTIFNFWTNQFSDNLVDILENVKEVNATNKQNIQFIWHRTLTASSTNQVTLRRWSRSGLWLFLHLFWMWHWCWFLQKNKIWQKFKSLVKQITKACVG